jgi:hypothetical protein
MSIVEHTYNPSTRKAEAGGFRVQGQPGKSLSSRAPDSQLRVVRVPKRLSPYSANLPYSRSNPGPKGYGEIPGHRQSESVKA